MRIIGGRLGGRKIAPPSKMPHTRPTTDLAKEGLFNTLQNMMDFEAISTLDLFGGTGCISYELASRGVEKLLVVEKDRQQADFIKKTAAQLGISNLEVMQSDVFKFLALCNQQFDFIFAGPPYALVEIDELPRLIIDKKLLTEDGVFVLEHTPRNNYEQHPNLIKIKKYGTTVFSFFGP